MKKIIYFCKHGEAVSDWNITSEVDWICSFDNDTAKKILFNGKHRYGQHLDKYISKSYVDYSTPVDMSNIDTDYLDVGKIPFFYSTHLVIDEIRARIAEGRINTDDVVVYVEDSNGDMQLKVIDEHGHSNTWFDSENVIDDILKRLFSI